MKKDENCNPDVVKTIIRIAIAILSAVLGALVENKTDIVTNLSNIF